MVCFNSVIIFAPQPGQESTVSAKALPHGVVEVKFSKGHSEGVNVYSERDGNNELVLLGRAAYSPYTDNRPLLVAGKPEVRKYRVIYVVNDKETGEMPRRLLRSLLPHPPFVAHACRPVRNRHKPARVLAVLSHFSKLASGFAKEFTSGKPQVSHTFGTWCW